MDQPPHGLLQDTDSPATTGRFRPYASTKHRVTRGRYITSNDRRGYIPVYEYPLNGQWIMMDIDDGYILWTGIWKALGNAKADIVKMLESQPDLAPQLRRVRGGYLKIQGTWMPYEVALRLARRVAWTIREDLIPLFGPTFPATCLAPDQPGYGQILGNQPGKRRGRRAAVPLPLVASLTTPHPSDSDRTPGDGGQQTRQPGASFLPPLSAVAAEERQRRLLSPSQIAGPSGARHDELRDEARYSREMSTTARYPHPGARSHLSGYGATGHSPSPLASQTPYRTYMHAVSDGSHHFGAAAGPVRESPMDVLMHNARDRFSPYQNAAHSRHRSGMASGSAHRRPSPVDLPPLTIPSSQPRSGLIGGNDMNTRNSVLSQSNSAPHMSMPQSQADGGEMITLPPINVHSPDDFALHTPRRRSQGSSGYSLPPISALSNLPLPHSGAELSRFDSAAVLRRLAVDDDELEGSRRSSFASAGDAERSHRDLDDYMIDAPTQEQLSRRRRSLSEPLLQPRDLSSKRSASGVVALESRTKPVYDVSTRLALGDPDTNPTSANHQGAGYSSARISSGTLARSRPSSRYRYGDAPTYSQAEEDIHLLSTGRTQHSGGQNHALAGQSKKQFMEGEKGGTSPVIPSERPAHPPYLQSGVLDMHPTRHTFVESSYRLESDSPHSLEEPSSASYQESQRYSIDKLPDSNFHSSSPRP